MPRMYCDMIGDLWHAGHASFCERVRELGATIGGDDDLVALVIGITNEEEAGPYKRKPILSNEERVASARACKFVDEVIPGAPLVTSAEFMKQHRIDYVVHGDDYTVDQVRKYYAAAMDADRYKTVPYTPGISTSDLIRRCAKRAKEMGIENDDDSKTTARTAFLAGAGLGAAVVFAAKLLAKPKSVPNK